MVRDGFGALAEEVTEGRVGHSFTMESLLAERTGEVEAALWTALTALEERIHLAKRLTGRMRDRRSEALAPQVRGERRGGEGELVRAPRPPARRSAAG